MLKKSLLAALLVGVAATAGAAQSRRVEDTAIRESTDPAKVEAVEHHAAQLREQAERGAGASGSTTAMGRHGMSSTDKHHAKRSGKHHRTAKQRRADAAAQR